VGLVYTAAEFFPWWAIPSALISLEIANRFRRSGKRNAMLSFGTIGAVLVALSVIYFINDGYFTARSTVKKTEDYIKQ
jgi:hypothetical protein